MAGIFARYKSIPYRPGFHSSNLLPLYPNTNLAAILLIWTFFEKVQNLIFDRKNHAVKIAYFLYILCDLTYTVRSCIKPIK